MSEENKTAIQKVEEFLTPRELSAYRVYMKLGQPPMSPSLQAELYNLFVQGYSCESIAQLNHQFGSASLGMIVRARVENDWDRKRAEYLEDLMGGVHLRLRQITSESFNFVSDLLAAAHKYHGEKIRRFIQKGDLSETENAIFTENISSYTKLIELILKLSGQDNNKRQTIGGVVEHKHILEALPVTSSNRPMTTEEASLVLKAIEGGKKE